MSNIRRITNDTSHYRKAYEAFERRSRKIELYQQWASTVFRQMVVEYFNGNTEGEQFLSLGIGSGSGFFESDLLREITARQPNIHHTVVEPGESYVLQYQSLVAAPDSGLHGITFDWVNDTWQTFHNSLEKGDKQFDFITAVNALYYVDDLKESIQLLHRSLKKDGVLMITLRSDQTTGYRLQTNQHKLLPWFDSQLGISSLSVKKILVDLDIPFEMHSIPSSFDITDVIDPENEEGNLVLDHLSEVLQFRRTAPAELVDYILDSLKRDHNSRSSVNSHNVLGIDLTCYIDWETIIVRGK